MQPGLTRLDEPLASLLSPDSPEALTAGRQAAREAALRGRLPLIAPPQSQGDPAAELSEALTQIHHSLPMNAPDDTGSGDLLGRAQSLRAHMQDDFVLMTATDSDRSAGADLRASLMAVAMPSGWDPAEKIGQRFLQLHQPVADAGMIRRAAPSLCAMMQAPGALRRHVWTLADDGRLSRHPEDATDRFVESPEDVWFRCERQTSYSLVQGRVVVFLIRVYVAPLSEVLSVDPARAALLHAALVSMSEPQLHTNRCKSFIRWWSIRWPATDRRGFQPLPVPASSTSSAPLPPSFGGAWQNANTSAR